MTPKGTRRSQLIAIAFAIAFVWLAILPQVAEVPVVKKRIQRFDAAGINPAAVFYTDHPTMKEIEQRVQMRLNAIDVEADIDAFRSKSNSRGTANEGKG